MDHIPEDEATGAGEDCHLLVVDVSSFPTGREVTCEGDVQQGVANSHADTSLAAVGNFSQHQQPFSSVDVGVPPLNLAALPQASPLAFKPATPGHSPSSARTSEQGGEELASAAVLTPTREQETSDTGEVLVCATQGTTQPSSAAKLAADVAERINEGINQKFDSLNERFEQKHDELLNMFQAFTEKSTATEATVQAVQTQLKDVETNAKEAMRLADTADRRVSHINDRVVQLDKKVTAFKHDMDIREDKEEAFEKTSKDVASFKKELSSKEAAANKRYENIRPKCHESRPRP